MGGHDPLKPREGDAVARFVRLLRDQRRMPVSFIQDNGRIDAIEPDNAGHMEAVLDALVAQAPAYRWSEMAGHYLLYPRPAVWDARMGGVRIANVPRLEAATQFVGLLQATVPGLADLSEPPMIGDPRSPVYTQTVSLPRDGPIWQHLLALLGSDPRVVFTVEPTRFGDRVVHFDRVPE